MKNKKLIENTETLPKKEGSIDNLNLNSGVRKIILDQLKAVNIFHYRNNGASYVLISHI